MNSTDDKIKIVFSTHDDLLHAQELAKLLVERRAAACVNLVPNVMSVFQWEDAIQMEGEILLIIKTTDEKLPELHALLEEQHTYSVPEMVAMDASVLHQPYLDWLRDCLG
jgi:periplasmic divalent cation tolerance protein